MIVQFVSLGLLNPLLHIPPPVFSTELLMKMQLVSAGRLLLQLYIPPPYLAKFPLNMQLVSVGLLPQL